MLDLNLDSKKVDEGVVLKNCNMCGKAFDIWDIQANFCYRSHIGYGSIYDGEMVDVSLCCGCFDKIMNVIIPMCQEPPIKDIQSFSNIN